MGKTSKKVTSKTIVYCRISTPKQSIESQRSACIDYCELSGIVYSDIITESVSARTSCKQIKLFNFIKNNKNCNIIVLSPDRFSRHVVSSKKLISILKANKIKITSINDNYTFNFSKDSDTVLFLGKIKLAQDESDTLSKRITRGIKYYKEAGGTFGKPGYGFDTMWHFNSKAGINIKKRIVVESEFTTMAFIALYYNKKLSSASDITQFCIDVESYLNTFPDLIELGTVVNRTFLANLLNTFGSRYTGNVSWSSRYIYTVYRNYKKYSSLLN